MIWSVNGRGGNCTTPTHERTTGQNTCCTQTRQNAKGTAGQKKAGGAQHPKKIGLDQEQSVKSS